jgi:adenosylcobinamide-phosphate synthase
MVMFAPSTIDPLLILFLGLVLEGLTGELRAIFRYIPHPISVVGVAVDGLERRLNRASRSENTRVARGALVVAILIVIAAACAIGILALIRGLSWGWLIELVLVAIFVAQRSTYRRAISVGRGLERGGLSGGRAAARDAMNRDLAAVDEHGLMRITIEVLFRNFADRVVAPVFWYALAGLPGLFISRTVETLDRRVGHLDARYAAFGRVAARFDTVLNFLPARLAGLMIAVAAAFAPMTSPVAALRIMVRDAVKHRSVNAGWPEAAAAGALGLALAGPANAEADLQTGGDAWIGDGRVRATIVDLRRALVLFVVACLINALIVGAAALARAAFES